MASSKDYPYMRLVPLSNPDAPDETSPLAKYDGGSSSSSLENYQDDGKATTYNPFADPIAADHWRRVYEEADYECRHVFEPNLKWSPEEERKVVRKLDWHVCLWACVMFFALQVDRGNLSQAVSDNMLDDLGMDTDDYNYGHMVFLGSFLVAEIPSQLLSKAIGPDRWIPIQMCLWSVVASLQGAVLTGRTSFLATRALLGLLEGGFIPDLVLWLSYFYTSAELPVRLSYFWATLSITGTLTSLMAGALLRMRGVGGWAGWRWLFLVEGLITLSIGISSFFLMPASAVQTRTWFRPQGWFTDREVRIVVNRVLRDDPSKGDMHNRQAITPRRLLDALADYDLWPLYALGLLVYIPQGPPARYLTLTLRSLGFDTLQTNLLTIPKDLAHIASLLAVTRLSEALDQRALVAVLQPLWTLPCLVALRWWPGVVDDRWGTYALVMTLLSYPYCHAILVGWCSRNSNNVATRSISAALYNMAVQLGNLADSTIYREDDKPYYRRGNTQLVIINCASIVLFLVAKAYYLYRNSQRDKVWNAMTQDERDDYVKNCKVVGSRRLDFRFAH